MEALPFPLQMGRTKEEAFSPRNVNKPLHGLKTILPAFKFARLALIHFKNQMNMLLKCTDKQ